jgi:hypothetical protein
MASSAWPPARPPVAWAIQFQRRPDPGPGKDGAAAGCDLMLFPELGLSAYAIDDLFLQDALLAASEAQ